MRLKFAGLVCVAFIAAGCGTHQSTLQGLPNSGAQVRQNNAVGPSGAKSHPEVHLGPVC